MSHPMQQIAEESMEAVGLVATLMERNERERTWVDDRIREGIERERDEWRDRALAAENRLARIEDRLDGLLT